MSFENIFDFTACTGKGVKVAVIDSGIDACHPDIHNVCGGVAFTQCDKENDSSVNDFHDNIGHGTACASLILKKAPDAWLYAVKIFDDELLETGPEVLAKAIKWAADHGIQVINLSLGTTSIYSMDVLKNACDYAEAKNCIIVAADTNGLDDCYPAMFPNVIGVTGAKIKDPELYHYINNSPIEFAAKGDNQRIAWRDKKNIFLERNSFAAPHISGLITKILEKHPEYNTRKVKDILIKNAQKEEVNFIIEHKKEIFHLKRSIKENTINNESGFSWIKNACIFPFNKEVHALVRARDLLPFRIVELVDVIGKGLVGKDAGEVLGIRNVSLTIGHNLDKALEKSDTLILGHVDELERIHKKDIFLETIEKALQIGKNVYHFDPVRITEDYRALQRLAADKHLKLETQKVEEISEKLQEATGKLKIKIPVVGVFGTSANQGKFTTQLALRKKFKENDYNIAQIGTEPHSELFGFDLGFPIGHNAAVSWPEKYYISYLHYKMHEIILKKNPDIFIVGAQSNIIPYDVHEIETINIGAIAFLFGTKPDAYILTVNSIDSEEHIRNSITGLESLGQGKTICMTMSDKEKQVTNVYGLTSIQYRHMSKTELDMKMKKIEEKFHIPVTDVVSEEGQQKLFELVVSYFSANNRK